LSIDQTERRQLEDLYGSKQAIMRLKQIMKGLVLQHGLTPEELQTQRMTTLQLIFERYLPLSGLISNVFTTEMWIKCVRRL
jgi:hypothetical protein